MQGRPLSRGVIHASLRWQTTMTGGPIPRPPLSSASPFTQKEASSDLGSLLARRGLIWDPESQLRQASPWLAWFCCGKGEGGVEIPSEHRS